MAEPSFPSKLPSSPMAAAPVGPPMAYLTEIRKESPASVVAFADACPCCGNKKRRCLYPSDDPRKKILVFDLPPTSTITTSTSAAASLTSPSLNASYIRSLSSSSSSATADPSPSPSPNPKRTPPPVLADRGSLGWRSSSDPKTSPPPPPEVKNPVADSGSGRAPTQDRGFLERSNSSAVTCSAVDDKSQSQSQGSDDISVSSPKPKPAPAAVRCSAEKVKGRGEVRIGVKCECGLTREIIFIQ